VLLNYFKKSTINKRYFVQFQFFCCRCFIFPTDSFI